MFEENADIVMTGNLVYRYTLDQIELEGMWSINADKTQEKFSYLFLKKYDKLICKLPAELIDKSETNHKGDYQVNICSANLCEAILINNANMIRAALQFLCGEYHGFFMYYDKTIEDRFYLNLLLNDNQIRLSGKCIV
jgi:hypothetical protein